MIKKMMLLAVSAAAVVAFAVPATASATPLVHDEGGNDPGTVEAVSENTISKTQVGILNCATVRLDVALDENTTETASGSGSGVAFGTPELATHTPGEHCEAAIPGTKITSVNVPSLHLSDDGTGHASFTFTLSTLPGCVVDGTADLSYSGSTLTLVNGTLEGTPRVEPCVFLDGTIEGDFQLQGGVTVG